MEYPEAIHEVMVLATEEAANGGSEAVEPLHLLIAVCRAEYPPVNQAFQVHGVDQVRFRRRARGFARRVIKKSEDGPHRVSERVLRILDFAEKGSVELMRPVDPLCVLVALFQHPDAFVRQIVEREEVPVDQVLRYMQRVITRIGDRPSITRDTQSAPLANRSAEVVPDQVQETDKEVVDFQDEEVSFEARGAAPLVDPLATPTLEAFGRDFKELARTGGFDPVVGRRDEVKQVVRILLRKQKNNPVLVGEPGVGKTSIVEGLALHSVASDAPEEIRRLRIVEILLPAVISGAQFRGEFEERLRHIVDEAASDPNIVLFLDEIHTLVGAGAPQGGLDAAAILKPALARGRLRCIGATTIDEYRRHIESDPALERRFQPVVVEEPSPGEAKEMLRGLRAAYEEHHGVEITDEAIEAAVEMSIRYLPDRRLPDKARDLIDQASAAKRFVTLSPVVKLEDARCAVEAEDVAEVVAKWTGIPVERLTTDERERLAHLEQALGARVIGQEPAVEAVSRVVRTSSAGLSDPDRPKGVFLFVGPTGVGKTELAKALAEFLFDDERRLIRFDMSEFSEEHSVAKLIGSPPGYVGHNEGAGLVDAVRRSPYSVLLFDEVEKASGKVLDLFLQVFDEGRLTDSRGRHADFRNAIIVLTSNLGYGNERDGARRPVGFRSDSAEESAEADTAVPDEVLSEIRKRLRPEFLNRIDRIVAFRPLTREHLRAVIDKLIGRLRDRRLRQKSVALEVAPEAYDRLAEMGYSADQGVREMERTIERWVVEPLAEGILEGRFEPGSTVEVVATDGAVDLLLRSEDAGE